MAEIAYKFNRLRIARAMRSGFFPGLPTNKSTHQLWNNSTGSHMLMVRSITWTATVTAQQLSALVDQVQRGTVQGNAQPFIAGTTPGPGQHFYQDTSTVIVPDLILGQGEAAAGVNGGIPIAALNPGWGLTVQGNVTGQAISVGFIWEYLDPADVYFSDLIDQP